VIDPVAVAAFVPAALALNLTPGADMMFCLAHGARGGIRPAIAASAGIAAGCMVHVTLAGLGLGALVARHPAAFDAIRWAGVAYLLWLAWKILRASNGTAGSVAPVRPARAFSAAMMVNLSNPKVILFVLALLPQFTDPARPVLPQFLILGGVLAFGGFVVNGAVGIFSGGIGRALAASARAERALGYLAAGVFGALALRLALEGRR
jgi:threonine/homoserine/homoserine lactone efflux protein